MLSFCTYGSKHDDAYPTIFFFSYNCFCNTILSVHHIHKTHEEQLDGLEKKYLEILFNIQKNGVPNISVFHPYMLSMKSPSQLYKEAHIGTYTMIRLKVDQLVNHALDSLWLKKSHQLLLKLIKLFRVALKN